MRKMSLKKLFCVLIMVLFCNFFDSYAANTELKTSMNKQQHQFVDEIIDPIGLQGSKNKYILHASAEMWYLDADQTADFSRIIEQLGGNSYAVNVLGEMGENDWSKETSGAMPAISILFGIDDHRLMISGMSGSLESETKTSNGSLYSTFEDELERKDLRLEYNNLGIKWTNSYGRKAAFFGCLGIIQTDFTIASKRIDYTGTPQTIIYTGTDTLKYDQTFKIFYFGMGVSYPFSKRFGLRCTFNLLGGTTDLKYTNLLTNKKYSTGSGATLYPIKSITSDITGGEFVLVSFFKINKRLNIQLGSKWQRYNSTTSHLFSDDYTGYFLKVGYTDVF